MKVGLVKRRYICAKYLENREILYFLIIRGSGGSKCRLVKTAATEPPIFTQKFLLLNQSIFIKE